MTTIELTDDELHFLRDAIRNCESQTAADYYLLRQLKSKLYPTPNATEKTTPPT